MRISKLERRLKEIKKIEGDIEVMIVGKGGAITPFKMGIKYVLTEVAATYPDDGINIIGKNMIVLEEGK